MLVDLWEVKGGERESEANKDVQAKVYDIREGAAIFKDNGTPGIRDHAQEVCVGRHWVWPGIYWHSLWRL